MKKKKRRKKNYKKESEFLLSDAEIVCITCVEYIPKGKRYCSACHYNQDNNK
jgi:hypothetical protein